MPRSCRLLCEFYTPYAIILWCRFHKAKAAKEREAAQCVPERDEKTHVFALSARAQKKWDELDSDQNNILDGDEVLRWNTVLKICVMLNMDEFFMTEWADRCCHLPNGCGAASDQAKTSKKLTR